MLKHKRQTKKIVRIESWITLFFGFVFKGTYINRSFTRLLSYLLILFESVKVEKKERERVDSTKDHHHHHLEAKRYYVYFLHP